MTIVKKYWRLKQRFYTSTPSQTVHLLTLLALPLLTIASNAAPLRRILRHMPSRIAPPSTSLPFKLPSRSLTISISRYIDTKTPSLIVARRTRAAAVMNWAKLSMPTYLASLWAFIILRRDLGIEIQHFLPSGFCVSALSICACAFRLGLLAM